MRSRGTEISALFCQFANNPVWFQDIAEPRLSPPMINTSPDKPGIIVLTMFIKKGQFTTCLIKAAFKPLKLFRIWFFGLSFLVGHNRNSTTKRIKLPKALRVWIKRRVKRKYCLWVAKSA